MRARSADRAAPFRLLHPPAVDPNGGPRLDPEQQAVVAHRGGPLLVLAGPGTGKTTTLVEAVLARIGRQPGAPDLPAADASAEEQARPDRPSSVSPGDFTSPVEPAAPVPPSSEASEALRPEEILVLTFSRAAAAELRDRIGARLTSGAAAPTATTFHSFCFALVGQYQEPELLGDPLRLLSGPEQEVVIRELVRGTVEPGGWGQGPGGWPQALRAALGTRGFAEELRGVLLRARDIGLDPEDLAEFARRTDRADWLAASRFYAEYLDVADLRGVLDYSELVHRAVLLAETDEVRTVLRRRYRAVFVDEYQDTDPAQVRLLQALAGDGGDLVAVGDPDQSIYAFRGADLNGILDFPEAFRTRSGEPAGITVLRTSRRAGPTLLAASREVAKRIPITRLPADRVREHRALHSAVAPATATAPAAALAADATSAAVSVSAVAPAAVPALTTPESAPTPHFPYGTGGRVEAITFPDAATELAAVADLLRRAHLEDGVPWEQMAVLVRAGERLALVRRALLTANVPVEVLGDDLPLAQEPAVGTLLTALRCAAEPAALTADVARSLLTGPLGGLDSGDLRRLGRALRAEEQAALAAARQAHAERAAQQPVPPPADSDPDSTSPASSDLASDSVPVARPAEHLIREAVADPLVLATIDGQAGQPAHNVARLLQAARDKLAEGGTVEDALWVLWHGDYRARPSLRTDWPERLRRAVERGGAAGRLADRDLDAVIALFALAARAQERTGHAGVTDFISSLQAQAIAADTLAEKAARGGAVQVLTAHRSKGLQWRVVVVAGVQEGLWPDLRRRGSLLEPDRIGRSGLTDPLSPAAILAEERRLFYVAVTRARERLAVTAVEGEDEDGESPSRFLRELKTEVRQSAGFRRRPLNLAALIAELRRAATDPAAPPELRTAAVHRLALLAEAAAPDGSRLVPNAHPRQWWGLYDYTENDTPVADPEAAVPLSASAVAALDTCGLRWFLESKAAAAEPSTDAQGIGVLFHALAEEVAIGKTKADIDVLMDRLDRVWDTLPFDAPWKSEQEKRAARRALERFLVWHDGRSDGRVVAAAEHDFDTSLTIGGIPVRLRGAIDRVEVDAEGRVYLVDFKTSINPKTKTETAHDPQLGVYQLVVEAGAYPATPAASDDAPDSAPDLSPDADSALAPDPAATPAPDSAPASDPDSDSSPPSPPGPTVAQAELVYPRDKSDAPGPTVLVQPGRSTQPDPEWAANLVADVAQRVLDERFYAYGETSACAICRLRKACPKQPEGRELPS